MSTNTPSLDNDSAIAADAQTAPSHRVYSQLYMRFRQRSPGLPASPTILHLQEQTPPLRVVRAFPQEDGAALVHVNNISGGVLGGDHLSINVTLDDNTRALLTTTGSTRIYRHRHGHPPATQRSTMTVGQNALLEFLPDSIIPYADSRYHQFTQINLQPRAGLFYWEVLTPGRVAHGERFAYQQLRMDLDISAGEMPIAIERIELLPHQQNITSVARLGVYSYIGTFYICQVDRSPAEWVALENKLEELAQTYTEPDQSLWGVSRLAAHGIIVRALSQSSGQIVNVLPHFWQIARQELYGTTTTLPRKIY